MADWTSPDGKMLEQFRLHIEKRYPQGTYGYSAVWECYRWLGQHIKEQRRLAQGVLPLEVSDG